MTNKNYFVLIIIAFVIVLLVGSVYTNKKVSGPHLAISLPLEHDLGKILQSGGTVSTVFDVYNDGSRQVAITDVIASCSCTNASVDKKILEPGDHSKVTVVFDPNYHYEDDGRFFRTVVIKSNAQGDTPEVKIWVEVDYNLGKDKLKFPPKVN